MYINNINREGKENSKNFKILRVVKEIGMNKINIVLVEYIVKFF